MITRKKVLFSGLTAVFIISCLVFAVPGKGHAAEYTAEDEKALKGTDPDAIAEVLYKLNDIHDEKGKEGMKPAVPSLIECAYRELKLEEDQRWNLIDIVKIVSLTGDERVKPLLLHIMSVMWGGGNPFTAQGFLAIGKSTINEVADSLKSTNPETIGRAAMTIHKMSEQDESGAFFSGQDRKMIRERLIANLNSENVNVRIYTIVALRSFGDDSVISFLEQVERHDAHKDSGGTYEVRIEATETLKKLRK